MSDIQVVRLHRFEGDSKLKAFCDVSIGDFVVKGFKLVEGKNGLFVSMPAEKSKDGTWRETVSTDSADARKNLTDAVLSAYGE